jgi:hypothetical protein
MVSLLISGQARRHFKKTQIPLKKGIHIFLTILKRSVPSSAWMTVRFAHDSFPEYLGKACGEAVKEHVSLGDLLC